jgi:subtilase family serine protease
MRKHLTRVGKLGRLFLSSLRRTQVSSRRLATPRPGLEALEARDLPTVFLQPTYEFLRGAGSSHPLSSSGPTGLSPARIRHAYGFDSITFAGGTITGDGTGQTIAIIDAYDDPALVSSASSTFLTSDLHKFDATFNLPDPTFTKVNQNGGTTYPTGDTGWALETSLDVEWAHVVAPKANILLVEANSNSSNDLFAAVQYAAKQPGVVAVSMSWGGGEWSGESGDDGVFTTPNGHAGVTFLASSGDGGAPPIYPSISPNVISVGGTTLSVDSAGNWLGESGWSGSGGGISSYEAQPSYQKGVVTQSSTLRTSPDVAYDSDPSSGVPVYDSYTNGSSAPWSQVGGTSAAAPQWAGLIAIADQGRSVNGNSSLDGRTQTLPALYQMSQSDFHDITSGTSTGSPNYNAGPGYDLVTGRGTPIAPLVVKDLIGGPQAQVSDGSAPVNNGGSISYTALVGSPGTQVFTVTNLGGATLTLTDPINLPSGFSLVSDFGSLTLAPGASTSFTVQVNTATVGTYSGTVSFITSDPNANPYHFTLTATVGNTAIIPNTSPAFSETGTGWLSWPGGYSGNYQYHHGASGADTAIWQGAGVPAGAYTIATTWNASSNHATNATYQIYDGTQLLQTVTVDQTKAPSGGGTFNNFAFQNLATVTISSGTLKVVLSDNGNGDVVADAVAMTVTANGPVAALFDGNTAIPNGGSDSFGTVLVGSSATRTFTVKNNGGTTLTLSSLTVPTGFTIVSNFGSTSLAPGASTTFTVGMNTTTAASYSGTAKFTANDPNNNTYSFTLSGTVVNANVIPNTSAAFSETGSGWLSWPGGYSGNYQYHHAASGTDTAIWQATGLSAGSYAVATTWNASSNHATNATYQIYDGSTLVQTVTVDQTKTPTGGGTYNNFSFQTLGTVSISSGTLKVVLLDNGNGDVVADAVAITGAPSGPIAVLFDGNTAIANGGSDSFGSVLVGATDNKTFTVKNNGSTTLTLSNLSVPTGFTIVSNFGSTSLAPGASTTFTISMNTDSAGSYSGTATFATNDPNNNPYQFNVSGTVLSTLVLANTSPTYFETGSGWQSWPGGYSGNYRYHQAASGADTAAWSVSGLGARSYTIATTWNASPNHATNAAYQIYDGTTLVKTVTVDQTQTPTGGGTFNNFSFQTLGSFTITSGTLKVVLLDNGNGDVVADAVAIS